MAFLLQEELELLRFKYIGRNVKISKDARFYDTENMEINDHSRIDDFCVLSGKIVIGKYVHIAAHSILSGGSEGIFLEDFSGLAYGACVFARSDDYTGETMTNPTIPQKYKKLVDKKVIISKHVIVGTHSVIFPGITLAEGSSIGAKSLVSKSTDPWKIYFGIPARAIKNRSKALLALEKVLLDD